MVTVNRRHDKHDNSMDNVTVWTMSILLLCPWCCHLTFRQCLCCYWALFDISLVHEYTVSGPVVTREYARGRRERRNRFRPADVAFFSSESDKNVALIFRKIRCFNIHFNIHTCHQLVFDPGRSSTRNPSGLHKKSIRGKGPVWEGSWCFPAKNYRDSLRACAMRRFAKVERIRHTNLTARLPKEVLFTRT